MRRGLGRGLQALIPTTEPTEPAPDETSTQESVRTIPTSSVTPNPFQPRTLVDDEALEELTQSVRLHGVVQPILVRSRDGIYELVAGERRWRAAQRAGLAQIPAVVRSVSDRESLEIALIENLQREDINAMDAAAAYRRLMDEFDLSQAEVAQRVGKSRSAIANTLRLLDLPPDIQDAIRQGKLSEGHGRALLSVSSSPVGMSLFQAVVDQGLSVRETERRAREALAAGSASRSTPARPSADSVDPNLQAAIRSAERRLGVKVTVSRKGKAGAVHLHFYDDEGLTSIFDHLIGD